MKVLVTGGAGFIGSNIVDGLIDVGYDVVIIDNLKSGKEKYINSKATFYNVDIISNELENIISHELPDYIIHHAAQIDVQTSLNDPIIDCNVNVLGTINILQNSVKYGVKKVIYASSAAVYGEPQYLPIDEWHRIQPVSFYGLSKYTPEEYFRIFSSLYGIKYMILRYANVYGIRQDPKGEGGVISVFLDRYLHGENPTIFGDGLQTRDFIYVKDVVSANLLALEKGNNETVNISCNTPTSILQLLDLFNEITGKKLSPIILDERKGDIKFSYLNNRKSKEVLGWGPKYVLSEGLNETIAYYNKIISKV